MRLLVALIFLLFVAGCATKQGGTSSPPVSIVPKPVHVTAGDESLQWGESVLIIAKSDDEKQVAGLLKEYLANDKLKVTVAASGDDEQKIILSTSHADSLGTEGYHLMVNGEGVSIAANSGAGLFYGVTSLLQIIAEMAVFHS